MELPMARRPDYLCSDCNHLWLPRKKFPRSCPSCGSSSIRENKNSLFGLFLLLCFVFTVSAIFEWQDQTKATQPPKQKQETSFSELQGSKDKPPEVDEPLDLSLKKPEKDAKEVPELTVIQITAQSDNAINLAQEHFEQARDLFAEHRFEESPLALEKLQEAHIHISKAQALITKLGALDKFGDTTLTRLLKDLDQSCQQRLHQLELVGIRWRPGAKKNVRVEVLEESAPLSEKPKVINKSGYGGKEAFHAKFDIDNQGPEITVKNVLVVFVDSLGLTIGKELIGAELKLEEGRSRRFSAKYNGENAQQIKTFRVQFD